VLLALPSLVDKLTVRHRDAHAFGIKANDIDIAAVFERVKGRAPSGVTP
jgi:hypothetical protein